MAQTLGVPLQNDKLIRPKEAKRSMRQAVFGTNIPNVEQKQAFGRAVQRQNMKQEMRRADLQKRAKELIAGYAQNPKKDAATGFNTEPKRVKDLPQDEPVVFPQKSGPAPIGTAPTRGPAPIGTAPAGDTGQVQTLVGGLPAPATKDSAPASESKPTFMGVSADPALEGIITGKPAAEATTKPKSIIDSPAAGKPSFVRSGSREDQFGQLMRDAARIADEGGLMMTDKKALEQAQQERIARGQAPLSMSKEQYNEFLMRNAYKDSSKHPSWMERTPADELAAQDAARDAARAAANPAPTPEGAATSGGNLFSQAQDMIQGAVDKAPATAEYLMQQGQLLPQSELSFEEGSNDPDMVATALAESAGDAKQFFDMAAERDAAQDAARQQIRANINQATRQARQASAPSGLRLLGSSLGSAKRMATALLGETPAPPPTPYTPPVDRAPSIESANLTDRARAVGGSLLRDTLRKSGEDYRPMERRLASGAEAARSAYLRNLINSASRF